jgi:nucleoside triphosphate diphosphatase
MERLLAVMRALRDPNGGCPWDLEQDFASIAKYTVEEAYEVADAIARDDPDAIKDELGDLLLQVAFHSQIAADKGLFVFADVVEAICAKMIRRHPHVFGGSTDASHAGRAAAWEADKARERAGRGQASAMDGVTAALPALTRADKLAKRAASVGFDWNDPARVWDKLDEELAETREAVASGLHDRIEDELGDVLFVVCNLARHYGVDPETALRRTNAKFERRFRAVEDAASRDGHGLGDVDLPRMEAYWTAVKKAEKESKKL